MTDRRTDGQTEDEVIRACLCRYAHARKQAAVVRAHKTMKICLSVFSAAEAIFFSFLLDKATVVYK